MADDHDVDMDFLFTVVYCQSMLFTADGICCCAAATYPILDVLMDVVSEVVYWKYWRYL